MRRALAQHEQQVAVGRPDFDPPLAFERLVADELETDRGRPKLLRALLIVDGDGDLADRADHAELLDAAGSRCSARGRAEHPDRQEIAVVATAAALSTPKI